MKGALDSLGVKPQERRAVILMLMAFFLIGNIIWLVFEVPALLGNTAKRNRDQSNIRKMSNLDAELKKANTEVATLRNGKLRLVTDGKEAQNLMKTVQKRALTSGLNITRSRPGSLTRRKGQDFEEFKQNILLHGDQLQLTDFLKKMADNHSMIRVSKMNIQPATNARKQLKVDLTFVASYPKPEEESKPKSKPKKKK